MKIFLNKILFLVLGIVFIPFFANATVSETKFLSEANGSITCRPLVEGSIAKNSPVTWEVGDLGDYGPVSITWSGTGVSGKTEQSVSNTSGYSTSGTKDDVSVTLEDESGPLTIKCNELTIKKTLSDIDPKNISCSSNGSSFKQKASVTWGLSGINFDEFGPITTTWSGTGVSGKTEQSVSNEVGYSTSGMKDDVSVTLEDESLDGPLTVKCNSIDITTSSSGGGSSGGGSVGNTCKLIGNVDGDDACDVDILDFNILALNWGSTISGNVADLNKDGIVNILDFNILALNWTGSL